MAMNANGGVNDVHVTGCTWIGGDGMCSIFDKIVTFDIMVNWMLFMAP